MKTSSLPALQGMAHRSVPLSYPGQLPPGPLWPVNWDSSGDSPCLRDSQRRKAQHSWRSLGPTGNEVKAGGGSCRCEASPGRNLQDKGQAWVSGAACDPLVSRAGLQGQGHWFLPGPGSTEFTAPAGVGAQNGTNSRAGLVPVPQVWAWGGAAPSVPDRADPSHATSTTQPGLVPFPSGAQHTGLRWDSARMGGYNQRPSSLGEPQGGV